MEQDRGTPQKKTEKKKSLAQRWAGLQPTKGTLFWSCVVTAVVTIIIGFNWGGWMTGGAAQTLSDKNSEEAVISRLAPICVAQFLRDPEKAVKLDELKTMNSYSRGGFVMEQGWATITGSEDPDRKVAGECAKLLVEIAEIIPPSAEPAMPDADAETDAEATSDAE